MYSKVKGILDDAFGCDTILNIPKDSKMGHFATPLAFSLAKSLKKNPNEIALDLQAKLLNLTQFSKVEVLNGYVNLTLSDEFLAQMTEMTLQKGGFGDYSVKSNNSNSSNDSQKISDSKQSILLEFVSANPTGPLHIGHARGAICGDTLARIAHFLGHNIECEYYINDAGNQIDLLLHSVYDKICEICDIANELDSTPKSRENFYKGDYILDLAKASLAHFNIVDCKNNAQMANLKDFCVAKMLDLIKADLKNANINFDNFVSEKSLIPQLQSTLEQLKSNAALYENDGKIWLKSTAFGDEKDRVIVRENGEPTYLAGDIVYHNNKFLRPFDKYINIWGADHHGYIARIKASVAFLGYDSDKLEVLLSQMVSLLKNGEPFKMSKRAGDFILMSEVIDEIGIDALRFVFLSKRADTHLEFDIASLKMEDSNNPIFYINYANARIHTLLGKSSVNANFNFVKLENEWKDLLFYALLLPHILEMAFNERAMQKLPEYLKNLASKLHFCYNSFKIIGTSNESAIISILQIVSLSITTGLSLMGIKAKTKM